MKKKNIKNILFLIPSLLLTSCQQVDTTRMLHDLLGHPYSKETVTKEATCTEEGRKTLECECGKITEKKIPAKGHTYEYVVKQEATCQVIEIIEGTCICGDKHEVIGDKIDHQYEWSIKQEATCENKEVLEGKCSLCNDIITEENEALGHSYGEYHLVNDATSTNEGLLKASCANGCLIDKTLKILKTPVISLQDEIISWEKVENATGYKLYEEETLIEDLGNVQSCNIPLDTVGKYTYSIEAYTDDEEYVKASNKSNEVTVSMIGKKINVYSNKIESVVDLGVVTGVMAKPSTKDVYNIGGTDLGIPYYDSTREQMYLLFGDTFEGINNMKGDWRSQVVGISKDLQLYDGLTFDSFISDEEGKAIQIIDSLQNSNKAGGEKTCIPTGGIEIDGVHYVYYMSVREWLDVGWDINFCSLAKSEDAQNFEILKDVYWSEDEDLGKVNAQKILDRDMDEVIEHEAKDFLQIFPYRVDEYVYLFGLTDGRFGGTKLARVKVESIEDFDEYEYYQGKDTNNNPIFIKGKEGLKRLNNNDASYIVGPEVGELSVCYNSYLEKYVMSYYSKNQIVMRTRKNLFDWDQEEVITTSKEFIQLYGGFAHELYMDGNGKVMYFLVSQYMNEQLGDEGYNVRLLKVTFK